MGAIPHEGGVAFRVWAPHADSVSVVGSFNEWEQDADPLTQEEGGYWYGDVDSAEVGDEYKFRIGNGDQTFLRIDPYAREVSNSVGNAIVVESSFDWDGDNFELPPWNELVVYEMHVGTFGRGRGENGDQASDFDEIEKHFDHLQKLGVNVVQLMPTTQQKHDSMAAGDVAEAGDYECTSCGHVLQHDGKELPTCPEDEGHHPQYAWHPLASPDDGDATLPNSPKKPR